MPFDPSTYPQSAAPIYRTLDRQGPRNIATSPANSTQDPWYGAASNASTGPFDPGPQMPNPGQNFGASGYYDPSAIYRQSATDAPQPQTLGQLAGAGQENPKRGGYWNEFGEWIL